MKTEISTSTKYKAPLWATAVATVCGVGNLKPGPGTWGSLVTGLLWWGISRAVSPGTQPALAFTLAIMVCAAGIPAATLVARSLGREDPGCVVIDEVAGQLITYIGAPVTWQTLLVGFILFRGFDIWKPPPARQLERLHGGLGIVADDVAAGMYALIVMQLLLRLQVLPR
jgi:phosphatidylglycerophosphatase A